MNTEFTMEENLRYLAVHPPRPDQMYEVLYGPDYQMLIKALHAAEQLYLNIIHPDTAIEYPYFHVLTFIQSISELNFGGVVEFVNRFRGDIVGKGNGDMMVILEKQGLKVSPDSSGEDVMDTVIHT